MPGRFTLENPNSLKTRSLLGSFGFDAVPIGLKGSRDRPPLRLIVTPFWR
jgi:hypothetical protein